MRLPALSYAVESGLGAAVVLLGVIVVYPDPPRRPKPAADARAPELPRPIPAPAPVPGGPTDRETAAAAEARRAALASQWTDRLTERHELLTVEPGRREAVWDAHLAALRADTVGAFEATPGKDAPWADKARAAFEVRARMFTEMQLTDSTSGTRLREEEIARGAAVAAGCDDPLLRYWQARDTTRDGAADPAVFRTAVERLYDSSYPANRRLAGVINWLLAAQALRPNHPLRADTADWETRFWELFAAAARRRTLVADEDLIDTAVFWQEYRRAGGMPRADALAELDRHIRRANGRDYLRRTVRGEGLVFLAWDARGNGTADTVTAAEFEVFRGHLNEASEVLYDAMESDPDGYSAPTRLLSVCLGLHADRPELEDVFRRAMHANPDNEPACYMRLEYFHPKWHGSRDGADYLRTCWALTLYPGDGWAQTAVLNNVFANYPNDGGRPDAAAFYRSEEGFAVVWTACRALEAARPTETYYAAVMARVACVARRLDVARVCFGRVGPVFTRGVFHDQEEYDRYRRSAELTP